MLERANVVSGPLEDYETVLRALNEYEVDSVFHLGAQTIVGTASRSPLSTFESNIKGTWVLLEACRQLPAMVKRVVVASSDKAYGEHEVLPYTEDAPLVGKYPYDVSKSCTDLISLSYFHSYGLPVAVTRCGNLYGPGDLNWNRLVPGTIRSALAGERPIVRSDGSFVRDYFYVRDAVDAYLLLAEKLESPELHGQAFNFGTETPLSVLELVDRILRAVGRPDLEPDVRNEASNEIPEQYLDCTKARTALDWSPAHTLEQGLAETVAWYRRAIAAA
jgi:CDP-glucose 4,6-dehydratase